MWWSAETICLLLIPLSSGGISDKGIRMALNWPCQSMGWRTTLCWPQLYHLSLMLWWKGGNLSMCSHPWSLDKLTTWLLKLCPEEELAILSQPCLLLVCYLCSYSMYPFSFRPLRCLIDVILDFKTFILFVTPCCWPTNQSINYCHDDKIKMERLYFKFPLKKLRKPFRENFVRFVCNLKWCPF